MEGLSRIGIEDGPFIIRHRSLTNLVTNATKLGEGNLHDFGFSNLF